MLASPRYELHVSRSARDRYGFADELFSLTGNVVFANLSGVRRFAQAMNRGRAPEGTPPRARGKALPEPAVQPGELSAVGLIDEVLHFVVAKYQRERDPCSMVLALEAIERSIGRERLVTALRSFCEAFPPVEVYRGRLAVGAWLEGATAGVPHRAVALEEMLLLWLANVNPASTSMSELFDDHELADRDGYVAVIDALQGWFAERPRYGPFDQPLVEMLRSPALAHPSSLDGQLDYIRRNWGYLLGDLLIKLLTAIDVLGEEERARWLKLHPAGADRGDSGRDAVIQFDHARDEPERFSHDKDWMPRVVLIAKSVHVWLDQLSRRHQSHIHRLDQIPDEELDRLAHWGVTGLWMIGVWERSRASARIKQLTGNLEAAASAYSLFDYHIAADLGGDSALAELRHRAWGRGIRLACDMVPNHMGIDSRWVIEHPDWFLSVPEPPFPAYSFHGEDLSWDERVGIQIEDHYYDRSDAAVVFRRADRWTGSQRFAYHGNDGTSFPWNDTAQLDYLKPEVREAVIQTILHVARQFPIIRFDAAMTLTKKHYQRLWFPEPGTGGAIPSRAEHGLTREQFDAAMPHEFWREVVDRAAAEASDTLLLAEAFWLMEGYFVRTLGMHRVYNSAFMNMLRDEENANYRSVIKNTLEFDPEVLKRYVNFMNNPDERTAVDQFGRGDKYFGVCTLMVTLPGLPMFGHGQVEGFEERYGMEYRRAYRDEHPDLGLVERHEREIFPLVHRRALFAEVRDFLLYDFFTAEGHVNEDVFAYSNRQGDDVALVVYHNRYAHAAGWIRTSVASMDKGSRRLVRKTLGEALGLDSGHGSYCRMRDAVSGLEYLRAARELSEQGLFIELGAYKCHAFLDIWRVRDSAGEPWETLARELGGRGVPSLDDALHELRSRPVAVPFRKLVEPDRLRALANSVVAASEPGTSAGDAARSEPAVADVEEPSVTDPRMGDSTGDATTDSVALFQGLEADAAAFLEAARRAGLRHGNVATLARRIRSEMESLRARSAAEHALAEPRTWGIMLGWSALRAFDFMMRGSDIRLDDGRAIEGAQEWRLDVVLTSVFEELGLDHPTARRASDIALALVLHFEAFEEAARRQTPPQRVLADWFGDDRARRILGVNVYERVEWFREESFEDWLAMLQLTTSFNKVPAWVSRLRDAARASGWRVDGGVAETRARR